MAYGKQTARKSGVPAFRSGRVLAGHSYDPYAMPESMSEDDEAQDSEDGDDEHEEPADLIERTTADDDISMNPLKRATVFHCKICRHVLTDSSAVVATCGSLDSLIINGTTKLVTFGKTVQLTKPKCEAMEMSCLGCKAHLGYRFFQVPAPYTRFAFCYSILASKVSSHTLGEMEFGSGAYLGEQFGPPVSISDDDDDKSEGAIREETNYNLRNKDNNPSGNENLEKKVQSVAADLTSVRKMIMLHNEALQKANLLPP